jgi:hypothetical protein
VRGDLGSVNWADLGTLRAAEMSGENVRSWPFGPPDVQSGRVSSLQYVSINGKLIVTDSSASGYWSRGRRCWKSLHVNVACIVFTLRVRY